MTFRLFIYYCALCGAWAALLGWILGRSATVESPIAEASIKGLWLGLFVTLGLSLVDALWNLSLRQFLHVTARVFTAVVVGSVGGMLGGMIGQALFGWQPYSAFLIFGWTLTGFLIGASIGVFELLARLIKQERMSGAIRKIVNGVIGGTVGGFLGGIVYLLIRAGFATVFASKPLDQLWAPSATGFVALGMCIGLMIGLAQVILKEAWIRIEHGFRAGRELILSKGEITVGRAEACDIGLFGDQKVERLHARISASNAGYLLTDVGTPGGTFLNGERITGATPLKMDDLIRVGDCVLRFGERRKSG
ncbi:MAG: FHA domain-containing protein [Gemmataceae bacterium]|nr:FHA domain-containing protein [Gemmataceae bacterium]